MRRRSFLKKSITATTAAVISPTFTILNAPPAKDDIIGHGEFRYRVNKNWGLLDPSVHPVKDCHEMVMDSRKRLIMITNETKNNILIYDKSGKVAGYLGKPFSRRSRGLHCTMKTGQSFIHYRL